MTDTIQFKHKHITNPMLSHHDKIMNALADCKAAFEGIICETQSQQLQGLQQIVENVQTHLTNKPTPVPRVDQPVPRVDKTIQLPEQSLPRVERKMPSKAHQSPASPRATRAITLQCNILRKRRNNLSHLTAQVNLPHAPPALSKRARVKQPKEHPRLLQLLVQTGSHVCTNSQDQAKASN